MIQRVPVPDGFVSRQSMRSVFLEARVEVVRRVALQRNQNTFFRITIYRDHDQPGRWVGVVFALVPIARTPVDQFNDPSLPTTLLLQLTPRRHRQRVGPCTKGIFVVFNEPQQ